MGRGTGATVPSHPKLDSVVHWGAISISHLQAISGMGTIKSENRNLARFFFVRRGSVGIPLAGP